ncbi:MAG: toxin-antitoxin system HicB family antitoxin [Gemmatimonas sp.]|nr:toxin-antitoxin system HicB family antitoxin [Gemmatimonas sp.]
MSTLSLRLPESLHQRARELAREEGVSINQLIATAVAEKISALDTLAYLKERAARGSREAFLEALQQVPDVPPVPGDEPRRDLS